MYSYLLSHKKYLINIPLIVYWVILFILTSLPTGLAIVTQDISDKVIHFGAYGLLSVFLYLQFYFQKKIKVAKMYPAVFTVLLASCYGIFDEIHQIIVPGRSCEFYDWLADFSGSLVAVLLTSFLLKQIREKAK